MNTYSYYRRLVSSWKTTYEENLGNENLCPLPYSFEGYLFAAEGTWRSWKSIRWRKGVGVASLHCCVCIAKKLNQQSLDLGCSAQHCLYLLWRMSRNPGGIYWYQCGTQPNSMLNGSETSRCQCYYLYTLWVVILGVSIPQHIFLFPSALSSFFCFWDSLDMAQAGLKVMTLLFKLPDHVWLPWILCAVRCISSCWSKAMFCFALSKFYM